jgi:hypothetical protein
LDDGVYRVSDVDDLARTSLVLWRSNT